MNTQLTQKQQAQNNALVSESVRSNTVLGNEVKVSTFDKSFQHATSFDSGKAIPILVQEVYPSDTYKIDVSALIRLSAPAGAPFMSINYDISFYYVPNDQIDRDFKQLMQENNEYGFSNTNIKFPKLVVNDSRFEYNENDLASYMGVPMHTTFHDIENNISEELNIYPFIAYGKIWNEWYRDQNLQSSINITSCYNEHRRIYTTDYDTSMTFYESIIFGKGLAPTSKLPSYFTTNLPYRQKATPVQIGSFKLSDLYVQNDTSADAKLLNPIWYEMGTGKNITGHKTLYAYDKYGTAMSTNETPSTGSNVGVKFKVEAKGNPLPYNVNNLRDSIVSQHLFENFALCGSRYVEQLKSIWGITVDPKTIQRTENIGGYNGTLSYSNVAQTSATSTTPQGHLVSNLYNQVDSGCIEYAAGQHGWIIGIVTVRTPINNGGQGLPKFFSYDDYLDLFNPIFNGIGEQPTLNKEIYYNSADLLENEKTFGFNEPFINTKYNIDQASGFMSLRSKTSLFGLFLFGEKYPTTPKLNDEWIRFNPNIIGNTLYNVSDQTKEFYHQFIALFTFNITYTTPQPLFNSPRVYGI